MEILVLGAKGMLGSDFCKALREIKADFTGWDIDDLDLTKENDVYKKLKEVNPGIIINCAAFTDVDGCESKADQAFQVNEKVPFYLAKACHRMDSLLVHFSSDFIFDGRKSSPYNESDLPNPISVYGASKLAGEKKIQEVFKKYFIIRTAWLYGKNGRNFVEIILDMAKDKRELKIVSDQIGSPTYTCDLVKAVLNLVKTPKYGLFQITNIGSCSRFDWAKRIFEFEKIKIKIIPCKTKEIPRPASRPAYSILDNTKFNSLDLGRMRAWEEALKDYLIDRKR